MSYGKLLIYKYLPGEFIGDIDELDFDDFFRLMALADISRQMSIEDMEAGTNKGIAASFGEEG